ncbi:DUF6455 family protein [Marivita sp. GX14005]|uniref:DUF6455 family protein n=1 Tax=Marivita sp. GX14005 TaxID=2942276 RepID=UPI0020191759|nr:DUF6455 family protein [Marivita sp. GX14005]MCL3881720.1 DUF6455 family protein [Marivita sp. GX14005]
MFNATRRATHTALVLGMADRQGIDLEEKILRAEMSENELERAVARCVGCTRPDDCKASLAQESTGLPPYCRNSMLFDALSAE